MDDTRGRQTRTAAASGWIGSALEYYDFFIYATAASLIFPRIFFPQSDAAVGIIASLATYGVGYVARPIGAIVLGHWGDTHGRKKVLIACMFLMGVATFAVGLLPTYEQIGALAPGAARRVAAGAGICRCGRNFRCELDDSRARAVRPARLLRQFHFARRPSRSNSRGCRVPAARRVHAADAFVSLGLACPVPSERIRRRGRLRHSARGRRRHPRSRRRIGDGALSNRPAVQAVTESWRDMLRVTLMALMNVIPVVTTVFGAAYAVQPGYGIGFATDVYLWIPVLGNLLAVLVIPLLGDLSDRIGRRLPMAICAVVSGLLSFAYLWAISIHSVPLAIALSLIMWGIVYQGYNAVFPSFYPELFPTRTRVSGVAIAQNIGTALTAMLPALFVLVAPPGASHVPLTVGAITFAITLVAALAVLSSRETFRVPLQDLGDPAALPVDELDYRRAREQAIAAARPVKAEVP